MAIILSEDREQDLTGQPGGRDDPAPCVTTALVLAAGAGRRLAPLTNRTPKCLVEVGTIPMLGRLTTTLRDHGFHRLIMVVGHMEQRIRRYLSENSSGLTVDYVVNSEFLTTNNLYSLWLAREAVHEPLLLIEGDLVFDSSLLRGMLRPDKAAVSSLQPWMNGTMVGVDDSERITGFQVGNDATPPGRRYKTVNMYSLSGLSWSRVSERLQDHVSAGKAGAYYETVFAAMVADDSLSLQAISFDHGRWDEIDTVDDLRRAERVFRPA